jgi:hypothetical protein
MYEIQPREATNHLTRVVTSVDRTLLSYPRGRQNLTRKLARLCKKTEKQLILVDTNHAQQCSSRSAGANGQASNPKCIACRALARRAFAARLQRYLD